MRKSRFTEECQRADTERASPGPAFAATSTVAVGALRRLITPPIVVSGRCRVVRAVLAGENYSLSRPPRSH